MANPEFWLFSRPSIRDIEETARTTEAQGWDGMTLTDSQNLSPDTYVALTLAAKATSRLKLGPGVTNPLTRHAAVTAGAIASLQEVSNGRAMLGLGRGDSALFNIGHEPSKLKPFEAYLADVQTYLNGAEMDKNGYRSKLHWLDTERNSKVPVDIAATGPKVIGIGARHADQLSFAVGSDPARVGWALEQMRASVPSERAAPSPGLYLNVCVHDDKIQAAEMVRGTVGIFAHFSGMKGNQQDKASDSDRKVYDDLGNNYERPKHGHADAAHAQRIPLDFIERFAIIGSPAECIQRIEPLVALGIERIFVYSPRVDHYGDAAREVVARFAQDVIPAFRH